MPRSVRIGELRERITIQQETRTRDAGGGFSRTWGDISTRPDVWARVEPVRQAEQVLAQAQAGVQMHRVTIRHRSDLDTAMRVLWGSRVLNIRGISNPDERRRYTELACEEKVAT